MNLKKLKYEDFINEIKLENRGLTREKGYEIHHILPKALGGTNDSSNLVKLTYFEHLVAHYLIAKEARCYEMYSAFAFLMNTNFQNFSGTEFDKLTEADLREIADMKALSLEKRAEAQRLPENREKISKSVKEYFDNNPQAREHQSKIHKEIYEKRKNDPEYIASLACNKGRKVYTNGEIEIHLSEEDPIPEGFYLGRAIKGKYKWFTDGKNNQMSENLPEGYKHGRITSVTRENQKKLEEKANKANTLYDELKYKVSIPLSKIRDNFINGRITQEEAEHQEKEIYNLREEIINKYRK